MLLSDRVRVKLIKLMEEKKPVEIALTLYHNIKKYGHNRKDYPNYKEEVYKEIAAIYLAITKLKWKDKDIAIFKRKVRQLFMYILLEDKELKGWSNSYLLKQLSPEYRNRKSINKPYLFPKKGTDGKLIFSKEFTLDELKNFNFEEFVDNLQDNSPEENGAGTPDAILNEGVIDYKTPDSTVDFDLDEFLNNLKDDLPEENHDNEEKEDY